LCHRHEQALAKGWTCNGFAPVSRLNDAAGNFSIASIFIPRLLLFEAKESHYKPLGNPENQVMKEVY
jgi:hypothetical protein